MVLPPGVCGLGGGWGVGAVPIPCFANLEGLPLLVEFGVRDTGFAQLGRLHLELMGRWVGLGLPLGR